MTEKNEEYQKSQKAAGYVFFGLIILILDSYLRLTAPGTFFLYAITAILYAVCYGLAYKEFKSKFIAISAFLAFLSPFINLAPISLEIKASIIAIAILLPLIAVGIHARFRVLVILSVLIIFVWFPLIGISFSKAMEYFNEITGTPSLNLNEKLAGIYPGHAFKKGLEKISFYWYQTKKKVPTNVEELKNVTEGKPIGKESEEEKEGKAAPKKRGYEGVNLQGINYPSEINQKEPFSIDTRIEIKAPTKINVYLGCYVVEEELGKPKKDSEPIYGELSPSRIENIIYLTKPVPILCNFPNGLTNGSYFTTISAYFEYLTIAKIEKKIKEITLKEDLLPEKQEPKKEITLGPIDIELNVPDEIIGKEIPTELKFSNGGEGKIKKVTRFNFMTQKSTVLKKIGAKKIKQVTCKEIEPIPCYENNNVYSIELTEQDFKELSRKRGEQTMIASFEIQETETSVRRTLLGLPKTFFILFEYEYELSKSEQIVIKEQKDEK